MRRGIIPARAGFTETVLYRRFWREDHPRSRGVYSPQRRMRLLGLGSSPLARGLRTRVHESSRRSGIIPARAGFTSRTRGRPSLKADHPRSRGVYGLDFAHHLVECGSSPLARGLRRRDDEGAATLWDHPRSRGVYVFVWGRGAVHMGSSPLARGLRGGVVPA